MKHAHFSKRAVAILLSSALLLIFNACSQNGGVSSTLASSAASSDEPASSSAGIPLPAQSGTSSARTTSDAPTDSNGSMDEVSGEYRFAVNSDNTVTITKYTGEGGNVKIPGEIDGKKVTAIGNTFRETGAFQDCTTLASVILPDGVTEIQDNAFQGCTSLRTVTIPASVTLLRNSAFDTCSDLKSVYFEGNAPQIADGVFTDTSHLTFYYHEGTAGWTDPWHGCPTMTYLAAGEYYYFVVRDDSSVAYFTHSSPNTVIITKYIGKGGDVVIPAEIDGKKVTAIGNIFQETGAFQDCTALTSVILPDGVTEIQDNAFQLCTSLKTVTIPASVTLLRNCAFDTCPNLQSIYFDGDAPQIANYVFTDTPYLTIYYHEGAAGWTNPWHGCPTETY